MRTSHRRLPLLAAVVAAMVLPLAACSDDDTSSASTSTAVSDTPSGPAAGEESAKAALDAGAVVIDVRTPEEYDAGHIRDAQLLSVQSDGFQAGVDALDPDATYVVYCRTGNRSAAAAKQMQDAGLTVYDGGAMDDMVAAGWPTA